MEKRGFQIRNRRNKGWFYLDNDYLNGYARFFGAIGTAIYVSLCRHADSDQKSFPSQRLIAEELNISERTVRNYLKRFEEYHIILREKERHERTKRWLNTVYYLLDKSEWVKPSATGAYGARGNRRHEPSATDDKSHRQQVPLKNTHIKNTHIRKEKIFSEDELIRLEDRRIRALSQ